MFLCSSTLPQGEFLDDRVGEELTSQLGYLGQRRLVRRAAQLDLEPLALAHAEHLREAKPLGGAGDRLALRVVNLPAEHHVNDYPGHLCLPLPGWVLRGCSMAGFPGRASV